MQVRITSSEGHYDESYVTTTCESYTPGANMQGVQDGILLSNPSSVQTSGMEKKHVVANYPGGPVNRF